MAKNIQTEHTYTSDSLLNIVDMPTDYSILEDESELKNLASKLYDIPINEINYGTIRGKPRGQNRCRRVEVGLKNNKTKNFYVKKLSYNAHIVEALAMLLSNILLENINYNFFISNNDKEGLVVMDKIPGKPVSEIDDLHENSMDSFLYGIAIEHSNALGLADRNSDNVLINKNEVINIDFEYSFNIDTNTRPKNSIGYISDSDPEKCLAGREYAKQKISERFLSNQEMINDLVQEANDNGVIFKMNPSVHLENFVNTSVGGNL